MKVVQLHEYTPEQFSNPTLTSPTSKKLPQIKSTSNVRIEGKIENES